MTADELRAGIANLNAILISGARSTTLGGQTVTYNTAASISEAIDRLKGELAAIENPPSTRRSKQVYAVHAGRGYHREG